MKKPHEPVLGQPLSKEQLRRIKGGVSTNECSGLCDYKQSVCPTYQGTPFYCNDANARLAAAGCPPC